MITPGSEVFLQLSGDSDRRNLCVCTAISVKPDLIEVAPKDPSVALESGAEIMIYFDRGREFVKQPATIEGSVETDDASGGARFAICPMGEPVSAEERQCFRTLALFAGVTVCIGDGAACKVVDISAMGLSFLSRKPHQVGEILPIVVNFDGEQFTGKASVQSVKELPGGESRYGIYCADAAELKKGLQKISMAVQREQLKRASGKAA